MPPKPSFLKRLPSLTAQWRSYSAPAERSIPPAKQKYVPSSGTYPKGFLAGSAFAGVKASNTKYNDLALIVSETPCVASAVFTHNVFKAAPVQVSRDYLVDKGSDGFRGVVVNSGCANAVTGNTGIEHAHTMARETDRCFSESDTFDPDAVPQTLVMSTGVIGQELPIDRIVKALPTLHGSLGSTHSHWLNAAQAICTTDTFPKLMTRTFTLPSHKDTTYTISGMTKGAGMIHPNMGTLLGIICTDVKLKPEATLKLLRTATSRSFNCISIDGDTSTNDTVALLANGAAAPDDVSPIGTRLDDPAGMLEHGQADYTAFKEVLTSFMTDLAKLVVRDGEGATKFVTVRVVSDQGYYTARRAAKSIATSTLVKTALYGKDANWGRILCALGYTPGIMDSVDVPVGKMFPREREHPGAATHRQLNPSRTSVSLIPADGSDPMNLIVRGEPEKLDEVRAKEILEMEDIEILVRLEDGDSDLLNPKTAKEAIYYTCDLSHEYVTINADYRT